MITEKMLVEKHPEFAQLTHDEHYLKAKIS